MNKKWIGTLLLLVLMTIYGCSSEEDDGVSMTTGDTSTAAEQTAATSSEETPDESASEKKADHPQEDTETTSKEPAKKDVASATPETEKPASDQEKNSVKETRAGPTGNMHVHYIDVGQADATLIEVSEKGETYTILIDAGDWNSNNVVNYLQQKNVKDIDILVGTHPHADHIGQIDKVVNQFNVGEVWLSGDTTTSQVFARMLSAIEKNDVSYHEPRAGETYDVGPLVIDVISPERINGDLNNGSIAMKLTYGSVSFLFTGDAETTAEQSMLRRETNLQADILHVGHHGSKTSTIQPFLDAVNPKAAIISVGTKNQYGHPHAEVVERIQKKGVKLYSTRSNGTVLIKTDGKTYTVHTNKDGTITPVSSGGQPKAVPKNPPPKKTTSSRGATQPAASVNCININSASAEEVQKIIHIGPARSGELVRLRPFHSVDDLKRIKGIGPSRINDINAQGLACIGGG